jgi:hypothetical protein
VSSSSSSLLAWRLLLLPLAELHGQVPQAVSFDEYFESGGQDGVSLLVMFAQDGRDCRDARLGSVMDGLLSILTHTDSFFLFKLLSFNVPLKRCLYWTLQWALQPLESGYNRQ